MILVFDQLKLQVYFVRICHKIFACPRFGWGITHYYIDMWTEVSHITTSRSCWFCAGKVSIKLAILFLYYISFDSYNGGPYNAIHKGWMCTSQALPFTQLRSFSTTVGLSNYENTISKSETYNDDFVVIKDRSLQSTFLDNRSANERLTRYRYNYESFEWYKIIHTYSWSWTP